MAYATIGDMIDAFGESEMVDLTDTTATNLLDQVPISKSLAATVAEIDASLRGRYELPLPQPVDPLLVRISCDLARELLYANRPTKVVTDNASRARTQLRAIASGQLRLDAARPAAGETMAGLVEIVSGRRKTPFVG
jgi:phage gp36-like protein